MSERKLITIFKSFVERVFVPQLHKMDLRCQQEWNKFSNMLSNEQVNLAELQLYVDTLPGLNQPPKNSFDKNDSKAPLFVKARKQSMNDQVSGGFNPSRTFGGQRARMMFPLKQFDDGQQERTSYSLNQDPLKQKEQASRLTTQGIMPTLENLFRAFTENQFKLERIGITTNRT